MEELSVLPSQKWAVLGSPAGSSAPEPETAFGVLEFRVFEYCIIMTYIFLIFARVSGDRSVQK
jgi:hypothetical protein